MFGAVELRVLREKVGTFSAGFDAALVTVAQANAMVDDAAAIEKMAATVKALLAARVADSEVATGEGDRSPAHALARKTGTTVGKAAEAIRTGRRLGKQPTLDAAARRGKVSPEQATAISDAAEADPSAEERLVGQASKSSLHELRNECERTKAAADRDAEERHRRILAARFARRRTCPDGSAEILYRSTGEQVAQIWSVISGYANGAFTLARREGRREPAQAYAADGMLAMAQAAIRGTRPMADHSAGTAAGGATQRRPGESQVRFGGAGESCGPAGGATQRREGESQVRFGGAGESCGPAGGATQRRPGESQEPFAGASESCGPAGGAPQRREGESQVRFGGGATSSSTPAPGPVSATSGTTPLPRRPPSPTRIVVRIDWDALVRGWVTGEETCEIAGVGQVPVSVVRAMMATDDPFLAAVVTRGKDVVNVAHLGRRPNAHQLSALDWLAPTCRREGCDAAVGLENDHRHEWATTRITLLDWIDRLCPHDHDLKTYKGWALMPGSGKRPLVPPEDPRHPRRAGPTRTPPPPAAAREPTRPTTDEQWLTGGSDEHLATSR